MEYFFENFISKQEKALKVWFFWAWIQRYSYKKSHFSGFSPLGPKGVKPPSTGLLGLRKKSYSQFNPDSTPSVI